VGQLESGLPFIVMECLEGKTLGAIAAEGNPLPPRYVLDWALQACEGLADAHAHGIVHRDLKPANLFLATNANGETVVKLLDFGISKFLTEQPDAGLTTTGSFVGSVSFAAPEQLYDPRAISPAADIWAMGVTLYCLLGRQLPFTGENRMQTCMLVMTSTPVLL